MKMRSDLMQPTFILSCESTIDLPYSYVQERELPVLFYSYIVDGEAHVDDMGRDPQSLPRFYQYIADGKLPSTSQLNEAQYEDFFAPLLEKGDVLHIAFGSGMTASVQNAKLAAEVLREKYPERKIVVIDTLCASMGEGLLDYKALELQKEGRSLEEVAQWVEENKLKICHFFMVEDLNHLQKGGRISKTAAVIGTMVQIKPIICLDNEGKLQIIRKERGRKKGMNKIVDMAVEACEGKMPDMVMIPHGNCPEDAAYVAELVRKKMGVTNVMMSNLGPVIGGHTGAGMIAIVCMADHR